MTRAKQSRLQLHDADETEIPMTHGHVSSRGSRGGQVRSDRGVEEPPIRSIGRIRILDRLDRNRVTGVLRDAHDSSKDLAADWAMTAVRRPCP